MKPMKIVLLCMLICYGIQAADDPLTLQGKVTLWNDIPLENVKITNLKSKQTTVSDANGMFSIEVNKKDKLRFSADGFLPQKKSIKEAGEELHVSMELLTDNYSDDGEPVNDGFRYIPREHRATAIHRLEQRRLKEFASYNSVWEIIRNRIPGVVVQNNNAYFREGLSGSVSTNSVPATIVLNGAQTHATAITNLDTRNIKDITLLKGAAAAVYGSTGGAGVISVTTR